MIKNRWLIAASALSLALAACGVATDNTAAPQAEGTAPAAVEKLAAVQMNPDTSFLNAEERQVVNLLIRAANQMSEIYRRQVSSNYDEVRAQIAADTGTDADVEFLAFPDLEDNLRTQVDRIRAHPWIKSVPVHGLVYEVETGRLREVA